MGDRLLRHRRHVVPRYHRDLRFLVRRVRHIPQRHLIRTLVHRGLRVFREAEGETVRLVIHAVFHDRKPRVGVHHVATAGGEHLYHRVGSGGAVFIHLQCFRAERPRVAGATRRRRRERGRKARYLRHRDHLELIGIALVVVRDRDVHRAGAHQMILVQREDQGVRYATRAEERLAVMFQP